MIDVLLIGCFDLKMHPYSEKYIYCFLKRDFRVKMIYRNRNNEPLLDENDIYIPFNLPLNTYKSKILKLSAYLKFYNFVKKFIKNNDIKRVVFLTTQTMVLFHRIAFKKFKYKYVYDYRDKTYEDHLIYKNIVKKCIIKSYKTIISSPGFLNEFKNLDINKFVFSHNLKEWVKKSNIIKSSANKIRLCFWGQIRQPNYFYKLFSMFGNDERFELNFYGEGYIDEFTEYIKSNSFNNIFLKGAFKPLEILNFARDTDVLINCYSNNSIQHNALSVKMYEGIYFNILMIVQANSYMSDFLKQFKVVFYEADLDNNISIDKDRLICLASSDINLNLDDIKSRIEADELTFYNVLNKFGDDLC